MNRYRTYSAAAVTSFTVLICLFITGCSPDTLTRRTIDVQTLSNQRKVYIRTDDIDQDGSDELIRFEKYKPIEEAPSNPDQRILVENLFLGKTFDQINIDDWGLYPYVRRESLSGQVRYGMISHSEFSYYVNEYDIDGNLVYSLTFGPFEDRNGNGTWQGSVIYFLSRDINNDDLNDPIFSVNAEYDEYPRYLTARDGRTGGELWRVDLGSMPSLNWSIITNVLGDSRDEIILGNYANSNGVTVGQTSDLISQVTIVSLDGEILKHYPIGGKFTTVDVIDVFDYDSDGIKEILIIYSSNNQNRFERNQLFWLDPHTGEKEISVFVKNSKYPNVGKAFLVQDNSGKRTVVLGVINDGLYTFDIHLRQNDYVAKDDLITFQPYVEPGSEQGFKVLAVSLNNAGQLVLYDESLQVIAQQDKTGQVLDEKAAQIHVLKDHNSNQSKIVLSGYGNAYALSIENNPLFHTEQVIRGLAVVSIAVSAVLIFLFIRNSRERKTMKMVKQLSKTGDQASAMFLVSNQFHVHHSSGDLERFIGTTQVRELKDFGETHSLIAAMVNRLAQEEVEEIREKRVVETSRGTLPVEIYTKKIRSERGKNRGYYIELTEQQENQMKAVALDNVAISQEVLHKIKTLISIYRSDLYTLKRNLDREEGPDLDQQREIYEDMEQVSRKIENLSRGYLNLTRMGIPNLELLDINEVVRETASSVMQKSPPEIKCEFRLDNGLPMIRADRNMMESLLLNLLENSLEAMKEEGILRLVTHEIEELQSEKTGHIQKMVLLEVHDTGRGISQQYKDQVFDPGYTGKETGIGMGLAVCKRIVALHHGSISFDSVAGKGTVVTIRLPYL